MRLFVAVFAAALLSASPIKASDRGSMEKHDGFGDAVTAPLEDLNIKRSDVPDVLRRAVSNPYDMSGMRHCEAIANEIGRLDAALGPDLDEAPPPDQRTRAQRLAAAAHGAGVQAVRERTQGLLPFRGWIRKLTGADRHDKAVDRAMRSGAIRRGYLKGVGMRMNCAPPAAPSWFHPRRTSADGGVFGHLWRAIAAWLRSWWPF